MGTPVYYSVFTLSPWGSTIYRWHFISITLFHALFTLASSDIRMGNALWEKKPRDFWKK